MTQRPMKVATLVIKRYISSIVHTIPNNAHTFLIVWTCATNGGQFSDPFSVILQTYDV